MVSLIPGAKGCCLLPTTVLHGGKGNAFRAASVALMLLTIIKAVNP